MAQTVKNPTVMGELLLLLLNRFSCVRLCATPWTAAYQAPPSMGFPGKSTGVGCNEGDLDSNLGLGRCPGEENGYPLQYAGLENSTDRGAWQNTGEGCHAFPMD